MTAPLLPLLSFISSTLSRGTGSALVCGLGASDSYNTCTPVIYACTAAAMQLVPSSAGISQVWGEHELPSTPWKAWVCEWETLGTTPIMCKVAAQ